MLLLFWSKEFVGRFFLNIFTMIEEILQEELEKYFSHIGQIGQYLRENLDEVFTLFDEASKYVG